MPLKDATDQQCAGVPSDRGAEWVPALAWSAARPLAEAMAAATGPVEIAALAYANSGRWVIDCPDCNSAQMACRTDQRFMCVECANLAVDGLWRPVTWPDEVATIEAVLEVRPTPNQNWDPAEPVEALAAENQERGLPTVIDLPDPPVVIEVPELPNRSM